MRCFHCHAEYDAQHFARIAENRFSLHWEDWAGWRFSGRWLIAPGKAGKILPARLLGILWAEKSREDLERRKKTPEIRGLQQKFFTRSGEVFLMPARERFDGQA